MIQRSPPAVLRRAFKYLVLISPDASLALDVYLLVQKVYFFLSQRALEPDKRREEKRRVTSALEV